MFLPRFFSLLTFALLLAGCEPAARSERQRLDLAEVTAGAGEVAPEVVQQVRDEVAVQLADLCEVFDGLEPQKFFVFVHASRAEMPDALAAGVHADAPGFALLGRHQVHLVLDVMRRTGTKLTGVVRHELVHELLDQSCGDNGRYVPRWFHEGLAQLLAGDTYLGASEDDLVWRVSGGSLRNIDTLAAGFPDTTVQRRTAYGHSYSYVAWLARSYGVPALLRIARYTDPFTSFSHALVGYTGRSTLELEDDWRAYVVHGSGARWRSLLSNWFGLLLLMALPVLVLALRRRLQSEERAGRRLAARARADRLAAEQRALEQARLAEEATTEGPFQQEDERDSR